MSSTIQSTRPTPLARAEERKAQSQPKPSVKEEKIGAAASIIVNPPPAEASKILEKKKVAALKVPNLKEIIEAKLHAILRDFGKEAHESLKPKLNEMLNRVETKEMDSFDIDLETAITEGLQALALKQMETLQKKLKANVESSVDFEKNLKTLTLAEQPAFEKSINSFDTTVITPIVNEIKHRKKLVFAVLQDLNLFTGSASESKLKMRDEYTMNWNSICLDDYKLKWNIQFVQKASCLMPKLIDLRERLMKFKSAVTEEKNVFINKSDDKLLKEKLSQCFEKNKAIYKSFDEEMKATDQEIRKFIGSLQDQKLLQEDLSGFAIHNDEVKKKVTGDLEKLISEMNVKRKEHWNALITRWKLACDDYKEISIQVDQLGSMNAHGIGIYTTKSVTKLRSWVVESWAPMSVTFDPNLRPLN